MDIYDTIKGKTFRGEWQPYVQEQGSCETQRGKWFLLKILMVNPATTFFLGHCQDEFGESGIVGTISLDDRMEFFKRYAGFEPFPGTGRFEEIRYQGRIVQTGNMITVQGEYHPTRKVSDECNGEWQMILEQDTPRRRAEDLKEGRPTSKDRSIMDLLRENA